MQCPNDSADLVMTERQGIEIDYCPKCRGVWLDRGELDKIIERSAAASPQPDYGSQPDYGRQERQDARYREHHDPRHKKRKSSFLGDLFEFGD